MYYLFKHPDIALLYISGLKEDVSADYVSQLVESRNLNIDKRFF